LVLEITDLDVEVRVQLSGQWLEGAAASLDPKQPLLNGGAHLASRYAVPYHPTSFREWKSDVMRGIAFESQSVAHGRVRMHTVETIEVSRRTR
jgi:hypothetical protein